MKCVLKNAILYIAFFLGVDNVKKVSVKKNYIYNMLYQLLVIVIPIITTPYVARRLGADGNGIYGYTISIVTYFILFGSLGISLYGQREIAYNQNNKEKRSNIFWELFIIRFVTMLLSAIIFYLVFCINGNYAIYYRILLIEMLANVLDISWFFQGLEDFKKIVIRNFIVRIISVICIFVFIKEPSDISKYLYIYVLSTLFGSLTLWVSIFKYISKPLKLEYIKHLPVIMSLFIPQIAIQIYTVLDKTMIGAILNDMSEVGYYEQSQKIIKILLTVITAIGTVMMPRIASCFAENNKKQIQIYMKKTFNFVFILSFPLMFGIIATAEPFTPFFFGPGYEKVPMVMSILSIIIVFISLSSVTGTQYLLSTKRQKEFTISVVIGAIVNFIFNLILINLFKSTGAAIATVIAELSVTIVQFIFVRKDFDLKAIFKMSIKYFIAGLIMFTLCYPMIFVIKNNLLCITVQATCGGIIYLIILLLIKDQFLLDIINNNITPVVKKIFKR